jgi:hypothetical protein
MINNEFIIHYSCLAMLVRSTSIDGILAQSKATFSSLPPTLVQPRPQQIRTPHNLVIVHNFTSVLPSNVSTPFRSTLID